MSKHKPSKPSWLQIFKQSITSFVAENKQKNLFEIVDIFDCDKTGVKLAVLKLQGHYTKTMPVKEIVFSNELIMGLSAESIRALTYLCAVEQLAPEYTIENLDLSTLTENYIVTLKAKNQSLVKQCASIISKDKSLIKKLNATDANKIGYMAGIKDTADEFASAKQVSSNGKI